MPAEGACQAARIASAAALKRRARGLLLHRLKRAHHLDSFPRDLGGPSPPHDLWFRVRTASGAFDLPPFTPVSVGEQTCRCSFRKYFGPSRPRSRLMRAGSRLEKSSLQTWEIGIGPMRINRWVDRVCDCEALENRLLAPVKGECLAAHLWRRLEDGISSDFPFGPSVVVTSIGYVRTSDVKYFRA